MPAADTTLGIGVLSGRGVGPFSTGSSWADAINEAEARLGIDPDGRLSSLADEEALTTRIAVVVAL